MARPENLGMDIVVNLSTSSTSSILMVIMTRVTMARLTTVRVLMANTTGIRDTEMVDTDTELF